MKTPKLPFAGIWHVVRQEYRALGEWKREYDFEPDEWLMAFFPEGRHGEIRRYTGELPKTGTWTLDAQSDTISIEYDDAPQFAQKCIFDSTDEGAYLYYYDGARHIRPARRSIIDHHAHTRVRLVEFRV